MKLLKQINTEQINEDAAGGAVGGGAVASVAMPLFATLAKRTTNPPLTLPKKKKKKPIERRLSEYVVSLTEDDDAPSSAQAPKNPNATYDPTEVFAKLKAFQNKESTDRRDAVTFGLEDNDGNIVRVTVKKDQAESFENALNQFLSQEDEVDQSVPDIAEVLFKLKDHFDIINVEWPEVEEDEEEDQQVNVQGEVDDVGAGEAGVDGVEAGEVDTDVSDTDAKGLLQQVIDMMMADADARKAEAIARQKEAEASVANNAAREAEAKVKQEEELLDMEQWEKQKKEEKKEAQKLAKLARWKAETGQDETTVDDENMEIPAEQPDIDVTKKTTNIVMPPADEEEEKGTLIKGRVKPADVASFIMSRIK